MPAPGTERTKKRVVVSLADTPQKRDGCPSPEQVNSTGGDVPETLLFHFMCAQEVERELLCATGDVVVLQAREMTDRCRGPYIGHRGEERFQIDGRRRSEALLFHLMCAQEMERELLCSTGDVVVLQAREMTDRC
jgi:hypothetical protein